MTTEQMDWLDDELAGRHRQQPMLPGMEDQAHELPAPVAVKKPSKKHKKKARSLRDMAFETRQAAQTVMRRDMERGVHQPQRAGEVFNAAFGSLSTTDEAPLALQVIEKHGAGLKLGMREWAIVQHLVEAGIRMGYEWAESGRAGS